MSQELNSSIIKTDDGYYFLDETENEGGGPYENYYLASAAQILYCLVSLGGYTQEHEDSLIKKFVEMEIKGRGCSMTASIREIFEN
jgi:hypothetical protein